MGVLQTWFGTLKRFGGSAAFCAERLCLSEQFVFTMREAQPRELFYGFQRKGEPFRTGSGEAAR